MHRAGRGRLRRRMAASPSRWQCRPSRPCRPCRPCRRRSRPSRRSGRTPRPTGLCRSVGYSGSPTTETSSPDHDRPPRERPAPVRRTTARTPAPCRRRTPAEPRRPRDPPTYGARRPLIHLLRFCLRRTSTCRLRRTRCRIRGARSRGSTRCCPSRSRRWPAVGRGESSESGRRRAIGGRGPPARSRFGRRPRLCQRILRQWPRFAERPGQGGEYGGRGFCRCPHRRRRSRRRMW
jgi:hypothetical protein